MPRTITLDAEISATHEIRVQLPSDVPAGPAKVIVTFHTPSDQVAQTLGDLAVSEFFGMWRDRPDIDENYAAKLRAEGWKRSA